MASLYGGPKRTVGCGWLEHCLLLIAVLGLSASSAAAATVGGVVDNTTPNAIHFFNADTDTAIGSVLLGLASTGKVGDCVIDSAQSRAFVTDFDYRVWVVDLNLGPPHLALIKNKISIPNHGEDLSFTRSFLPLLPVGNFLLACDGSADEDIAVIHPLLKTVVSTFDLGEPCNSVQACVDGSVLVTTTPTNEQYPTGSNSVRRLVINPLTGKLTDTGEVLPLVGEMPLAGGPNNVTCASNAKSGIVVTRATHQITSFTIPGLTPVHTRTLSAPSQGGVTLINRAGTRVFNRQVTGEIDVFGFTSATGALSATPLFTILGPVMNNNVFFGMEQMALNPQGTKLYVSRVGGVDIFNPTTGAPLGAVSGLSAVDPTGICFREPGLLGLP